MVQTAPSKPASRPLMIQHRARRAPYTGLPVDLFCRPSRALPASSSCRQEGGVGSYQQPPKKDPSGLGATSRLPWLRRFSVRQLPWGKYQDLRWREEQLSTCAGVYTYRHMRSRQPSDFINIYPKEEGTRQPQRFLCC